MSRGGALPGLLRRPAALAWIPLSALVSLALAMFGMIMWWLILGTSVRGPASARMVVWAFPALIGLLVGQASKELQHCHFSWILPGLRRRLLRGAVVVGLVVAVSTREILTALLAPLVFALANNHPGRVVQEAWLAFPAVSVGAVAVAFMAFWIGVRPSAVSWLGVMAPLIVFSTPLTDVIAQRPVLVVALTTPLTVFLIHQAFGVSSARSRPFISTKPLVGDAKRIDQPRAWTRGKIRGAAWRIEYLGDDVANWVRAGAYENHGFRNPVVRAAGILIPVMVATFMIVHLAVPLLFDPGGASIWNPRGAGGSLRRFLSLSLPMFVLSPIVAIPISVLLAAHASIALTRRASYPLSRRQMARIEFWGSVAENLVICGLLTAVLIGFWSFGYGLGPTGPRTLWARLGYSSWVPFLLRPMAVVFLLMPVTQLFRLHYLRTSVGWSSVRQFVEIMGLILILTALGTLVSRGIFGGAPRLSLLVDGPLFVVVVVLTQVAYRRLVGRYFATADLV